MNKVSSISLVLVVVIVTSNVFGAPVVRSAAGANAAAIQAAVDQLFFG
jgi:hypothetical protein